MLGKIKNMKRIVILVVNSIVFQMVYSQKNIELTYERKDDKSIEFYYEKKTPGSYYLIIDFTTLENCNGNNTYKKVIKHKSGSLLTLRPANPNEAISFSYEFKYSFGNPKPKINNDITYALPFKEGNSVKIIEASNVGEKYFGTEKPTDWKSFIFYSNEQDTIYSMRKGTVVKINSEFESDQEFNKTYTSKRNSVLIEHQDGTYASYKGFGKSQIFVKLGQEIYPHTPLGKIEKFNKGNYRLDFNIFHYLNNLLEDKKSTLVERNHKRKYLNPNFFINNKNAKIKTGEIHLVSFNEGIKLQEFSRREKKQYQKKPNEFN